jgi:hypothetical protein
MACFPMSERNGKAKRHRTLVAVSFLKCDLLAYKPGQFIRGGPHEVFAWRLCNLFAQSSSCSKKRHTTVTGERLPGSRRWKQKPRRFGRGLAVSVGVHPAGNFW